MLNRTLVLEPQPFTTFPFPDVEEVNLKNGIKLYALNYGIQEVIKLEVVFNSSSYKESKQGVSLLSTKMLSEGTKNFSSKLLADKIAGFGSFLELIPGQDKIIISIYTLPKHLHNLLPILYEILQESTFPQENFEHLKSIQKNQLKVSFEKTSFVATGLFKQNIFGANHPYGYFISESKVDDIQWSDCVTFYNSNLKDNAYEIILSGKFTPKLMEEIENTLGNDKIKFPFNGSNYREIKPEPVKKVSQTKDGSLQSSLRIGRKLFTKKHPDYLKFTVLNQVLGGYFGSRLMKNIREEKGLTYGIHSHVVSLEHEGYFMIGTDVKKEWTEQALVEIYKEIELLKTEPIGSDEFETVINYMIGSYLGSINSPFALADKFKSVHFNGLPKNFYHNYIENLRKITPQDLMALANKYFEIENLTEVVVG
jgi:zinc protease